MENSCLYADTLGTYISLGRDGFLNWLLYQACQLVTNDWNEPFMQEPSFANHWYRSALISKK